MKQISCYQTVNTLLEKTVCLVAEKCYLNNFRVIIITPDVEMQELINKVLWSYSQKQFIPHGSSLDPAPEIQPVYITTDILRNQNNANALIFVNKFIPTTSLLDFDRVSMIYNNDNEFLFKEVSDYINGLNTDNIKIDRYKQTLKGNWELIPI